MVLGWEFRWLILVYFFYFVTSVCLDLYYIGLYRNTDMAKNSSKTNYFFQPLLKIVDSSFSVSLYRKIKLIYFILSFVLYIFSFVWSLLLSPVPTIDSFGCNLTISTIPLNNGVHVRYYYPIFAKEKFQNSDTIIFNRIIITYSEGLQFRLSNASEIKMKWFKKYLLTNDNLMWCSNTTNISGQRFIDSFCVGKVNKLTPDGGSLIDEIFGKSFCDNPNILILKCSDEILLVINDISKSSERFRDGFISKVIFRINK